MSYSGADKVGIDPTTAKLPAGIDLSYAAADQAADGTGGPIVQIRRGAMAVAAAAGGVIDQLKLI